MEPNIVVIRLKNEDELLAILNEEHKDKIVVEYPYFVRFDISTNAVAMTPYCSLSLIIQCLNLIK